MKCLAFCLTLCLILLSACGGQEESTPAPTAPETASGTVSTSDETAEAQAEPASAGTDTESTPAQKDGTAEEAIPGGESTAAETETAAAHGNYEELSFFREGFRIAGRLYLPEEGEGPFPLVILCHGYGGNMRNLAGYAEIFAVEGYAAVIFDFAGGGVVGSSDGTPLDMTVL